MSKHAIAFYNLENLFDTINNPHTLDDDFTPGSEKAWTQNRLEEKVIGLSKVIASIGEEETNVSPAIIGVAEVENKMVLEKLVNSEPLINEGYAFVHYESSDERGIDTALLYKKDLFEITETKPYPLHLFTPEGERDFTRDILYVKGILENQDTHILINHWPSRRAGEKETAYKRLEASKRNREIIDEIRLYDFDARIIIMGDFNDDPKSESLNYLEGTDFYNPMKLLLTKYEGSLNYRGNWNLFDQILISTNFMKPYKNPFSFETAKIFNGELVEQKRGKYKGNPSRTYVGKKYLGGVSDHFPVYGIFNIKG